VSNQAALVSPILRARPTSLIEMKIQIQDSAINAITNAIARSVPTIVRQAIDQLNEDELVRAVRVSGLPDREKVLLYLKQTQQNCTKFPNAVVVRVLSDLIRSKLGVHPHQMKPVREALVAENLIEVPEVIRGPIEIVYRRPRQTTAIPAAAHS